MLVSKIVSGGQTGVDRGALEAALELGFPYGGLIPKGRKAEDGQVPAQFDKMEVSYNADYLFRTEWNVTHSDATLIISRRHNGLEVLTGGTKKTLEFAVSHQIPRLVIFSQDMAKVIEWLKTVSVRLGGEDLVLNVAGPRESKAPGIQNATRLFITKLIEQCKENENECT